MHTLIDPTPGSDAPGWLGPSAEVDGRYRILMPLGQGGVGMVWIAEHLALHRKVALKVLNDDVAHSPSVRKRFEREAQTLASLSHPNIVAPTDYGVWEGSPYLVMELLEGQGLDAVLEGGVALPRERALDITQQLLRALVFAHARGVVHRDLKPGNVFLQALADRADHVKLLDFGFAKAVDEPMSAAVTSTGVVVGTPAYMAPEAATGAPLDARADIYAVGVLLFQMLTGKRPFEGEPLEILRTRLCEDAPRMRTVAPERDLPEWLDDTVARALTRKPEDRWQTAAELSAVLAAKQRASEMPESATIPEQPGVHVDDPSNEASVPRPPMLAFGLLAVLGVAALVWNGYANTAALPDEPTPTPAPSLAPAPSVASAPSLAPGPTEIAPPPSEMAPPESEAPIEAAPPIPATTSNPWDLDVPAELEALRRTIHAPAPPSRDDIRALRTYAQAHRDDPRPVLLLAHAFARMHWMDEALETYARALEMSPSSAGDPEVLPQLVTLAGIESTSRAASDLVATTYGAEAAPVIDATLAAPDLRPADRERLEALRSRVTPE